MNSRLTFSNMIKIILKIMPVCFLLYSCKEATKEQSQKSHKSEVLIEQNKDSLAVKKEMTNNLNDDVEVKFSNLSILLKDIDMSWKDEYNINDNIYETKKDTAFFYLNPGDWMYGKSFKIEQTTFDEIELYEQIEVKIAIETKRELEVPICILEDWKGYTSKWKKNQIDKKDLKFPIDQEKTEDHPISFTLDEFKLAVEKHCGIEWLNEIRNIESLNKLPTSFFTTRYIYKIKLKNSKTNEVVEKFIVFYTPTSC